MKVPASTATRHTCLKLEVPSISDAQQTESVFVKGAWFSSHFTLSVTDGLDAWVCEASEEDVKERASQWDLPVIEYIELAERYLGFQQPGSVYGFSDAGNGHRRLSWTFEKEGTKLEWRWRCKPSPNSKMTAADILDFLMDANIRLSEEVVRKTQAFDMMKEKAERSLELSERLVSEKEAFENEVYAKFVSVLNSKKAKLRELRDKLSKMDSRGKSPQEEENTSSRAEAMDSSSDDDGSSDEVGTSVPQIKRPGRKKIRK